MRSEGLTAVLIRALQCVLAVGALGLGIRVSVGLAVSGRPPPVVVFEEARPTLGPSGAAERFDAIANRDLFHRKVEEPVASPPPPVVESTLEVELLGTLVRGNEDRKASEAADSKNALSLETDTERPESIAILRDVDGNVRTLAKGGVFADERAKLVGIERGRIVLEHEGRLETVTLEESGLAAKSGPPRPTYPTPQDPASKAAAAKAAEIARMQREVQRRMREAMPQAATQPVTGKN